METSIYKQTIVEKNDLIFIKPLCDFFGIDYDNQVRKINNDPILQFETSKKTDEIIFGDKRERLAVSKRGFFRWIQILTPSNVHVSLREKFQEFQVSIFDYLYKSAVEKENTQKQINKNYFRLKRLRKLYNKVGNEIKSVQKEIEIDMERTYGQQAIEFENQKQLNS